MWTYKFTDVAGSWRKSSWRYKNWGPERRKDSLKVTKEIPFVCFLALALCSRPPWLFSFLACLEKGLSSSLARRQYMLAFVLGQAPAPFFTRISQSSLRSIDNADLLILAPATVDIWRSSITFPHTFLICCSRRKLSEPLCSKPWGLKDFWFYVVPGTHCFTQNVVISLGGSIWNFFVQA